jgi:hypothetical protein
MNGELLLEKIKLMDESKPGVGGCTEIRKQKDSLNEK